MQGHPFRIRYDVPLVAACAALTGAGIGLLWSRARPVAAAIVVAVALVQAPPLDRAAPLIVESQRDAANMAGRRAVTAYLDTHHDGRTIMMSMGSLGHYMHDLSAAGFRIHDFLHEGNGDIWNFALLKPRGHRRLDCDRGAGGGRRLRCSSARGGIRGSWTASSGSPKGAASRSIGRGEIPEVKEATRDALPGSTVDTENDGRRRLNSLLRLLPPFSGRLRSEKARWLRQLRCLDGSEPEVKRHRRAPATEIDLVSEQAALIAIGIALCLLPSSFAADA